MVKSTIQIFCRVKPPRRKQIPGQYDVEAAENGGENLQFLLPKDGAGGYVNNTKDTFLGRFQRVFDVETKQEEIFDQVAKPVIDNVLSGFNGTIFAFGQTGSGKTFTITGGPEKYADRGIIPRSISHMFREFDKQSQYLFTLHVSYLEIYNNHGYDLLDPRHEISKLEDLPKVTTMEDSEHTVHLKNLSLHLANTEEEALNLLFLGDTNRMIAETPMNMASTRSHCIFTVHVTAREHGSATIKKAKLHLVDLAGSERVAKTNVNGKLLDEAKYINASLHSLELVIISLSEKKGHVPYRNSMMTTVLKDSLGGNCMTTMIATCSIERANIEESISTVRFAQRVAMIKNEVTLNEELDPKLIIAKLKRETEELKNQLHFASGGKQSDDPLEEYEIERCKATVQAFLEDADPDAVVNVGADMRKINECFRILKAMLKKRGGGGGGGSEREKREGENGYRKENYGGGDISNSSPRKIHDSSSKSTSGSNNNNGPLHQGLVQQISDEHLKKLQELLLQRDNEIAILVNMLKKEKEKLGQHKSKRGGGGGGGDLNSRPSSATSLEDKDSAALTGSRLILGELSVGRQQAFEIFKRDYAENGKISAQKEKLKANFRSAKDLGEKVNSSRETINRLKAQIEHYRVSLAMSMGMSAKPNDEPPDETETLIRDKLENEKRNYRFAFTQLKELKTEIEHQQHLLEKYRVKLQKDFDGWWTEQCHSAPRQKRLFNSTEETSTNDSLGAKTSWMTPAENGAAATKYDGTGSLSNRHRNGTTSGAIPSKGRTKSRTLTPVQSHAASSLSPDAASAAAPPAFESENTLMSVTSIVSSVDSASHFASSVTSAAPPRTEQSARSLPGAGPKPNRYQLDPIENKSAPPLGSLAEKSRGGGGRGGGGRGGGDRLNEYSTSSKTESGAYSDRAITKDSQNLFTPAFSSPPPSESLDLPLPPPSESLDLPLPAPSESSYSIQSTSHSLPHCSSSFAAQLGTSQQPSDTAESAFSSSKHPSVVAPASTKPPAADTADAASSKPPAAAAAASSKSAALAASISGQFNIPLTGDPKADADIMAFIKARAKIKAGNRDKR